MASSFDFARQRCAIIGQANAALNYIRIDREDFDRGKDIRRISAKSKHSMEQLDRNFPTFILLSSRLSSYLVIRFAVICNFTSPFNIFEFEICSASA